jgi:hypothetical protein
MLYQGQAMTREQIIETMARGIDPYAWDADTMGEPARHSCRAKAERCLSALEAAGLVIVPVEPGEMFVRNRELKGVMIHDFPSGTVPAD